MRDGALIGQYRMMHADGAHFPGRSLLPVAWHVWDLVKRHGAETLLDYGCGQGEAHTKYRVGDWWGVRDVTLYDPAVSRYAERPRGRFDGVICSDVLEHIPDDEIDAVIRDVLSFAVKFAFFSICCRPSSRSLPNGMNCHVTVRPPEWWHVRIKALTLAMPEPRPARQVVFTP